MLVKSPQKSFPVTFSLLFVKWCWLVFFWLFLFLDSLGVSWELDRLSMVVVVKELFMFMGHIYAKEVFIFLSEVQS